MLQNQRTSELLDGSLQQQGEKKGGADLVNLVLRFLRRQYLVIIIATALAPAASVIFLRMATIAASLAQLLANSGKRSSWSTAILGIRRSPPILQRMPVVGSLTSCRAPGPWTWRYWEFRGMEKSGPAGRTADEWRARTASSTFLSGSAASWGARRAALRRPAIPTATTASPVSLETS